MSKQSSRLFLTRRGLLAAVAVVVAGRAEAAATHPSVIFMRQVAKDMLNAHRQGTVESFRKAIVRYADVQGIALYSLGQYKAKLPADSRTKYFGGVATFMARYFAEQSREYNISKYEVGDAVPDGKEILVDSRVFLTSGETYTVMWRLAWRKGSYKITDVKVLGFSMVYLQRGLFTSYISKRNGDVGQLVSVLTR